MSAGISAAAWVGLGSAAVGAVSASKAKKGTTTKETNELDPRYAPYVFGDEEGTNKGLLSDAYDWYSQNKSGLNDEMREGLNSQWNVLSDPKTMGGFQQMSNLGSGLMGTSIAGNPFSDGRAKLMAGLSAGGGSDHAPGGSLGGGFSGSANLGVGNAPVGQQPTAQGGAGQFPSYQMPTNATTGGAAPSSGPFSAPASAPGPAPFVPSEFDGLIAKWQTGQDQSMFDAQQAAHWVDAGYPERGVYGAGGQNISFDQFLSDFRKAKR